jgi:Skp family chaperone for outer membrane proteins
METIKKLIPLLVIMFAAIAPAIAQEHPHDDASPTISYDETESGEAEYETQTDVLEFDDSQTEDLMEFKGSLDTLLGRIEENLDKLDRQLVRITEKVALSDRKEREKEKEAEEIEVPDLMEDFSFDSEESDTLTNLENDYLLTPVVIVSDYQKLMALEEEKRDLMYTKNELFLKSDRFKESLHIQNYKDAERYKVGIESLMDEINQGIYEIREKLANINTENEG